MVKHRQGTTFIGITYVCSYDDGTIIDLSNSVITAQCSYDGIDKIFTVGNGSATRQYGSIGNCTGNGSDIASERRVLGSKAIERENTDFSVITLIVISIISAILSGFSKAVCDNSEENRLPFYKKTFWIKDLSWQNKWKNGDRKQGEKFFLSSTILVLFTDAWHLFGTLFRLSFAATYVCIGLLANQSYLYLFGTVVAYSIFALSFHLFYNSKLLRK